MRAINTWLPPTVGLLAAAITAVLATAPHSYTWPRLLIASIFVTLLTSLTCAAAMFLIYVVSPQSGVGPIMRRTSATAALFPPLVIFLRQTSIWSPVVAALLIWTIVPEEVAPKPQWKKFVGALIAAVLLQIGVAAWLGSESLISSLSLGFAAAPILWRIRQERNLRGPYRPRVTAGIALLLTIFSLTYYLPFNSGSGIEGAYAKDSGSGKKAAATPGFSVGGKYRGVILSPEEEQHVILVPPLPMMGRDPFRVHKDPIGIPFYGVYWLFQAPDKQPNEDAYRLKGSPDHVTFRSADVTPLKMEAHQNLGRLIDLKACSRIEVVVRNADNIMGSLAMELIVVNTTEDGRPWQWLGQAPIASKAGEQETLSFKIPAVSAISQFDELTIRFVSARYRATRSAKVAIERFFLVPRSR